MSSECECLACSWQGVWTETDSGICPECGGMCVPMEMTEQLEYSAHHLPGRGRRNGGARVGVIHLAPPVHGDNFRPALCGKKPGGLSLGWKPICRAVTCKKCASLHQQQNNLPV